MVLGFHYHITAEVDGSEVFVPGFFGVFVDSLAENVQELVCFFYTTKVKNREEREYVLKSTNIRLVDLGAKRGLFQTFFLPQKTLVLFANKITKCDHFLIRSPSPLAPLIYSRYHDKCKFHFLLVGDYVLSVKEASLSFFKKIILKTFYNIYQLKQNRALSKSNVIVNSGLLYSRNKDIAKSLHQIKTTTLSRKDFYQRKDTCEGDVVKLLYTGRFDWAKGFKELLESVNILVQEKAQFELHFVGWENGPKKTVELGVKKLATELGIDHLLFFHGKKSIGAELNDMYRVSDIYVIPSYAEGFPRTIWEAMANSCPVIATSVGSIPLYLKNQENALIVEPRNTEELTKAIRFLIKNTEVRKRIIKNGYLDASGNTLEEQTQKLMEVIDS